VRNLSVIRLACNAAAPLAVSFAAPWLYPSPMSAKPTPSTPVLDRIGLLASALCVIHCLVLPLLAILFTPWLLFSQAHLPLVICSVALAMPLFLARTQAGPGVIPYAASGTALLVLGAVFLAWPVPYLISLPEALTVAGAVLLAVAHLRRLKNHRTRHKALTVDCCKCP
jgi:hypothetical protein